MLNTTSTFASSVSSTLTNVNSLLALEPFHDAIIWSVGFTIGLLLLGYVFKLLHK